MITSGELPSSYTLAFEPILTRLAADSQACFDIPEVRLVPVGHEERPFSFLVRVAVWQPGGSTPIGHAFLKIYKPKDPASGVDVRRRVVRDFEVTRAIHDYMAKWNDAGAVRPIACYGDLLAIVTEEAPGETLLQRLEREAAWFPERRRISELAATMTACGRWLNCFQQFDARGGEVALADLAAYVDVRLKRLVEHSVFDSRYRERILKHLDRLAGDISSSDLKEVSIHADLAPGNILVHGPRIVVLDFAMASRGTYVHDISRLFLQIDLLRAKPHFRPKVIDVLQSALLRGLDPALTSGRPLFRYLLLLHRVNHLGTQAIRRERFPSSVLNARVLRLHRRWIDGELAASEQSA